MRSLYAWTIRISLLSLLAHGCASGESTVSTSSDRDASATSDARGERPTDDPRPRPDGDRSDAAHHDAPSDATDPNPPVDPDADPSASPDTTPPDATPPLPDGDPPIDFGGEPVITLVFPQVTVPDGLFYIEGERLAAPPNDISQTEVQLIVEATASVTPLRVVTGVPGRLVVGTPLDIADILVGPGRLRVTTPEGIAEYAPIYTTRDTTFTGKTGVGAGLLGNVYRLQNETRQLPNMDDACADPTVIGPPTAPCPFTSVLVAQLDIPERDFESGFPGLLEDLVEWFAIRFTGYFIIDTPGVYGFRICSDDGSRLDVTVGGARTRVVNNDGAHSMRCEQGEITLPAERVPFILDYFQGPRNRIGLQFYWRPPGTSDYVLVPESILVLFPIDP